MIRILIIIFFILTNNVFSEIKKINIVGNQRVNTNTIETLIDKKVSNIDSIYINNLIKKIFDTDFFLDVKITYNQDVLTITVVENSIVNFFYINGIKDADLDQINKIITLKENSIFSLSKLKKDIEAVKNFLNAEGYYRSTIDPEVIKIDNNQINLIINIDKKEISKIKHVYFIGDKFFSSAQLLDTISSSEDSWWKFFSSSVLSEERIIYDKQLLKDFYKSKGFYDAQIESAFAIADKDNNYILTFSINSGKKYKFGEFEIKLNSSSYKEQDLAEINLISDQLLKNKTYSPFLLIKLNKEITSYLELKKYKNFEIILQEQKKSNNFLNVVLQLNDEQKIIINKITVSGNSITDEKVIRDSLMLSESDYLNLSKVSKSIDNIKSKQLFSKVDYKIEDSDKKNFKDFNLFVKEQPTGNISAGIGYGTNGGIFEAGINERNFLGQGINLNFTGRLSTQSISGVFNYNDPNFKNTNKDLTFSIFSEKDDFSNSGYQNKKIGTNISTKYEIYEDVFFRPNVGAQYDNLDISGNASNLLRSKEGSIKTSSVGYAFTVDKRDSKFNPTSGTVFHYAQDIDTFISDITAFKTGIGATIYKELFSDKFIGSAKGRLANSTAINNKDIKISDRLYSSSSDLRGFEQRGVGPVDSGEHIGGNNLATLSLKSTFPNPIPDNLRPTAYLFLDMGNVWGADYSDVISNSSKLRSTTGIGLDVMSPIGPLSFIFSIPISKVSSDKEQNFLFNIGSSF